MRTWLALDAWMPFSSIQNENLDSVLFFKNIFEPWAPLEKVTVLDVFYFLCDFYVLVSTWLEFVLWMFFQALKLQILISYCFLQHFWAVGTSRKGVIFRLCLVFSWFLCLGENVACIWCVNVFSVTQDENLELVLLFIAFWSRRHLSKRCLF